MSENDGPAGDTSGGGQIQARDGRGKFLRSIATAQKDALAAELRARGHTYAEIAVKLAYGDASAAAKAVNRALRDVPTEEVTELRALECARLDDLTRRLFAVLDIRYPFLKPGRDFVNKDGQAIPDPGPILAVIDRLTRISDRRARLLGLDAPPPKPEAEPKPGVLELTAQQVGMLQRLLQALPVESADTAPLALTMATEKPGEAA